MRAIYQRPAAACPGWPVGSEMQLAVLTQGPAAVPGRADLFLDAGVRRPAGLGLEDLRLHSAMPRPGATYGAGILDVPPTGLAAFFARGGKLLLSHGWTDGLIPANNTLRVPRRRCCRRSAPQQAASQYRLFMVPGMDHCGGGEGASQFDTLGTIDEWATSGTAPERIVATRPTAAGGPPGAPAGPPRAPMSRPLCPYPPYAAVRRRGRHRRCRELPLRRAERRSASEADAVAIVRLGRRPRRPARRLRAGRRAVHGGRHRGQLLAPARRAAGGASGRRDHRQPRRRLPREAARQRDRRGRPARWSSASARARS